MTGLSLNLTQLKDLEYICQLAQERLEPAFGLQIPWLERIAQYRKLLIAEISRLENTEPLEWRTKPKN